MRRFLPVAKLLLVLSSLLWTACEDSTEGGSLTVYSAGPRPLAEQICRDFEKSSGIQVRLFSATSGQIMAKLEAEKYRPRADVVILASQIAGEALAREGRLESLPAELQSEGNPAWNSESMVGTAAAAVGVAVRGEAVDRRADWWEWLRAGVEERMVMPSPSRSGTAGDFLLAWLQHDDGFLWEDFVQARRDGLDFAAANNQAITQLLTGSHHVLFAAVDYLIFNQIARGESLTLLYPEPGAVVVVRPGAIVAGSRNREAALQFLSWYLQPEAQNAVAEAHLLPALAGVEVSAVRKAAGPLLQWPYDPVLALDDQQAALRRFQYEIERTRVEQ